MSTDSRLSNIFLVKAETPVWKKAVTSKRPAFKFSNSFTVGKSRYSTLFVIIESILKLHNIYTEWNIQPKDYIFIWLEIFLSSCALFNTCLPILPEIQSDMFGIFGNLGLETGFSTKNEIKICRFEWCLTARCDFVMKFSLSVSLQKREM